MNETQPKEGVCDICGTVHAFEDLDQSAYGESFIADVLALSGPNASRICNVCINDFVQCQSCNTAMRETGIEICEVCANAPQDESPAELLADYHRKVL